MIFADYTFPPRVASIASAKEIEFVYLRYFFLVHLIKKKKKRHCTRHEWKCHGLIMKYSQDMLFIFA